MRRIESWATVGGLALVVISGTALGFSREPTVTKGGSSSGGIRGIVSVGGAVTYSGMAPAAQSVDMSGDAYCTGANAEPLIDERMVVGSGGGLANVIVYVKEGLQSGSYGDAEQAVVLDQRGCNYLPHIVTVRTKQTLVIRNSDQTLHNVHAYSENNRGFNIGQPLRGLEARRQFQNGEVSIRVQCDVHGWMQAYIAVFEHPFFVVTGHDGRFSLDDLPPGDYVLEAWHESLGVQTQSVIVTSGGNAEVSFVFGG